jgi:hypothetical protein
MEARSDSMRGTSEGRAPGCARMMRRLGCRSKADERYRCKSGRGDVVCAVWMCVRRGARTVAGRLCWYSAICV